MVRPVEDKPHIFWTKKFKCYAMWAWNSDGDERLVGFGKTIDLLIEDLSNGYYAHWLTWPQWRVAS